jgi:hypothetical protein
MVTRKAKLGKEIDQQILNVLKDSENPISTRDLALKIGRAWYSVQTHCLKLQVKGKIKGFNVTNINVWELKK